MKKLITLTLVLALAAICISVSADEILFRNIPWGTSISEVKKITGFQFFEMHGESYKTFSVDAVLHEDYDGIKFEYTDINLTANSYSSATVAGYTTSDMTMYFAYIPVDGAMVYEDDNTALYGARYIFEPQDIDQMSADLISKLSSIYGEPSDTSEDSDLFKNKYHYTYWEGDNGTTVVLRELHATADINIYKDEIQLAYAWKNGDTLLQAASDTIKQALTNSEQSNYGNGDISGL